MSDSTTPSRALRRAGIVAGSAVAMLTVASPAFALPGAPTAPAAPHVTPKCSVSLNIVRDCINPQTGTFVDIYRLPAPPALPAPPSAGGVTQPLGQGAAPLGSAAGGVASSLPSALPGAPGAPSLPSAPGQSGTSSSASGGSGTAGTPAAAPSTAKAPGATADNLLGAASAFLPSTIITSFADLGSTPGSLASVPIPDLASLPQARLQDVQAPLLAAAQKSSNDTMLQALRGKVLPGLLIVLATVIVALVGAGNVRVWQTRLAARRT